MNAKLYIKRKISAAHYLPDYDGPCSRMHGHTWKIEMWLEGSVDPKTGMLVDFKHVKSIIDWLDHSVLNECLPNAHLPPTAENLAAYILYEIPFAVKVRVWESEDCYAEVPRK